jgi:hypothetical protein
MPTPPFQYSLYEDGYRDKLMPAFHLAYGEFIRQFGQTESTLAYHLEEFVVFLLGDKDLHKDIARALLGSRRTPELANATKLCLKAAINSGSTHTVQDTEDLNTLFAQLAEVRFLRDRTAHYAIHPEWRIGGPIYFRALNRYTVNDLEKTEELLFTIEHIEAATTDLKTICLWFPRSLRAYGFHVFDPSETRGPWLYRPSELVRTPYREPRNPQ